MLRCNLSDILWSKHLRISKVSMDTKISRPTLTSLCSNAGCGIRFDTLDTLCQYLSVSPSELFTHVEEPEELNLLDLGDI